MNPPQDTKPESWHRYFGATANNRAWEIAEASDAEINRDELLNAAHASAWHWGQIGTELHRMRATMLLAEAHAKAGLGATALAYADEMRAYFLATPSTPDWEIAFTHVVHAHAANAAHAHEQYELSYAEAVRSMAAIADDEDRAIVQRVFRHVPAPPRIQFDDGGAYETYMGKWSQLAGDAFLDWLAPASGLRWIDVGCGNGAFTEMIVDRCAPASVQGIDPSEAQVTFARTRLQGRATFDQGDAMALPSAGDTFDVATMALVIFFVPEPAKGVAEMVRVVRPGGTVAAYGWDLTGGGFPYEAVRIELHAMGFPATEPPSPGAAALDSLTALWQGAGLEDVETRVVKVQRTFADFEDYWATVLKAPSARRPFTTMSPEDRERLKGALRARVTPDAQGRITIDAHANAVRGRRPQRP